MVATFQASYNSFPICFFDNMDEFKLCQNTDIGRNSVWASYWMTNAAIARSVIDFTRVTYTGYFGPIK